MTRVLALGALAVGCLLSVASTAPQSFDAAWRTAMPSYYGALLASARNDVDGTTRQLLLFSARVKDLAARSDTPAWATDATTGAPAMAAVARSVETARQRTLARDMPAAHASLERVRYLLRDARARHAVRTFDDAITDYHEAMERLTSRVGLHNEILLAADDYQAIQEQAARASHAWTEIETSARAEKSLPGWSATAEKTAKLLGALQKAATSHDPDLAQTTSESLKAAYYELIGALARATS